jgi:hypothetical protein
MKDRVVLKAFSLAQGAAIGAFTGSVLSLLSTPVTLEFLPRAALILISTGLAAGLGVSAIRHRWPKQT